MSDRPVMPAVPSSSARSTQGDVLELRQYTLRPGKRDALIELFERAFVEPQEALGMRLVGQFRDAGDPDRFVWLRSFGDMESRADALAAFYGGPVWKAHREAANATMIDSDDVLLLGPLAPHTGFAPPAPRPPAGAAAAPSSLVTATICARETPIDDDAVAFFLREVRPALDAAGAAPAAIYRTESAENTFPALPVRSGEHVVVWFTTFADAGHERDHAARLAESAAWNRIVLPGFAARGLSIAQQLRLEPTPRSSLR